VKIKNHIITLKKLVVWVESDNAIGRKFYDKKGFKAMDEKSETIEETTIKLIRYDFLYKTDYEGISIEEKDMKSI
jgi:hypothetical protein